MEQITHKSEFKEKGYVIQNLLSGKEIDYLNQVFRILPKNSNQGFYTSLNHDQEKERKWVNHCVKQIFYPKIASALEDYEPLFGTFTIKKPGETSKLAIHLDWSVVDEDKHNAIGVWVPLCEVNPKNGAFGLLEGSFKFGKTIRGSMINFLYAPKKGPNILSKYIDDFPAVQFSLSPGTAIIYDMRTAHFSSPNLSEDTRIAANLIFIPKIAKPKHYFKASDTEIKEFEPANDYFLQSFLGAHDTKLKENRSIEIKDIGDIEEQHETSAQLSSIKQIDLRQKKVKKPSLIGRFQNMMAVKHKYRKFSCK